MGLGRGPDYLNITCGSADKRIVHYVLFEQMIEQKKFN